MFGTLIALLRNGEPIIGVIDQPITKERWVGVKGHGTTLNGRPSCSHRPPLLLVHHVAESQPLSSNHLLHIMCSWLIYTILQKDSPRCLVFHGISRADSAFTQSSRPCSVY